MIRLTHYRVLLQDKAELAVQGFGLKPLHIAAIDEGKASSIMGWS
ncbi:MAG: hypothetical protein AABP62_28260 [Planctomycetota bacterium]